MKGFLDFIEDVCFKNGLTFYIYYSSTHDWYLQIDYKHTHQDKEDKNLFTTQDCDVRLVIAKAEVFIKNWLIENKGGY